MEVVIIDAQWTGTKISLQKRAEIPKARASE